MTGTQHQVCLYLSGGTKLKKECSFVICHCGENPLRAHNQPAVLISGCVTLQSLGALWSPRPLSVQGLSCHGPGYSEHCHTLHHHRLPRFQRTTLRTVGASHKYSSILKTFFPGAHCLQCHWTTPPSSQSSSSSALLSGFVPPAGAAAVC